MPPRAVYNAVFTGVHQLQMLSFSHVKLLVLFGVMGQAMTGTCYTSSVYAKEYLPENRNDICALQSLMLKEIQVKKKGGDRVEGWGWGGRNRAKCRGGLLSSNTTCTLIYEMQSYSQQLPQATDT